MERRWQTKDDVVTAVVAACHREIRRRSLTVSYRHQPGHQSTSSGSRRLRALERQGGRAGDARRLADRRATRGVSRPPIPRRPSGAAELGSHVRLAQRKPVPAGLSEPWDPGL